jgi:hypothetical protein
MLKAAAVGLLIAILLIVSCQAVTTITYRHVQNLALRYAGVPEIPLSLAERFFVRFSEFWARYFVLISILIVPVCVSGAMLVAQVRSRRTTNAA